MNQGEDTALIAVRNNGAEDGRGRRVIVYHDVGKLSDESENEREGKDMYGS
jgi:hypothetical protein